MSYAQGRRIVDADSHLMEWPGFLVEHAEPSLRDRMPRISGGRTGLAVSEARRDAAEREALAALGDDLLRRGPKWYAALGAVDPRERASALDLLGFEQQVIYSSLCAPLFDIADPELRYGAYRAHNRALAAWCAADPRLLGVGLCDLDDRARSLAELDFALDLGLREIWIPARAPGGRSPGHDDNDAFWARLAERGVPFVLHVGSGALPIGSAWTDNGRPATAPLAGAEILTSKDFLVVYQPVARFLSVLVLDGVLERHPRLRGGAIEMGAGWVPDLLRRLDHAVSIWRRSEPELAAMSRLPSEQAAAQLRFTPYPFEDVGQIVRESDPRLYLFSSDYPHAEGGRDPLRRFERALDGASAADQDAFFAANAREWLGLTPHPSPAGPA
jgi:predicted TIM-barrel fold metal-dependent hydrolase